MRRAAASEHRAQHLLHGRLADRTGHRDDARPRPRASGDAQPLHGLQRVLDRESGAEIGEPTARSRETTAAAAPKSKARAT